MRYYADNPGETYKAEAVFFGDEPSKVVYDGPHMHELMNEVRAYQGDDGIHYIHVEVWSGGKHVKVGRINPNLHVDW